MHVILEICGQFLKTAIEILPRLLNVRENQNLDRMFRYGCTNIGAYETSSAVWTHVGRVGLSVAWIWHGLGQMFVQVTWGCIFHFPG